MKPALSPSSKSKMISEPLPNSIAYVSAISPYVMVTSTPAIEVSSVAVKLKPSRIPAASLERTTDTALVSTYTFASPVIATIGSLMVRTLSAVE